MTASAKRVPTRADLPAIIALLERANETPYDIGRVAEEKVFGAGLRGSAVPEVYEEDGKLIGISVTCGRALRLIAVDPEHRRRGIGSQLLGGRVAFAEPGNYFTPGVIESDTATRAFFTKHGFIEERWTSNLETSQLPDALDSYPEPRTSNLEPRPPRLRFEVRGSSEEARGGTSKVQRVSDVTRERVLSFVENRFGRAWRFECENAGSRLFYIEHEGEIAGFAAHDANNRGLGFFGPTGVAESMRGRGFGTLLLHASLADLASMGYTRVVIPWTEATDFYAKACAARVTHRFVLMSAPLSS